jgi:hypothetical protein
MSVKNVFIRAATAYAAASLLTIPVKGITPKHEVRALAVVIEGTLRSAAAGGINFDARDYQSIAGTGTNGGVFKKLRLTYNDKTDAINLSPQEARVLAVYANGRDPFPEHTRSTPVLALNGNAGAVKAFKLKIPICFYDSNLEFPNVGCPSSMQLNRDGVEINLETDGAHVMTVGDGLLPTANGNTQVVVSAIKLYATTSKCPADFFAPTQYMRSRKLTQQPDTEKGPIWERFLAAEVDPVTYEAQVASITVEMDEVASRATVRRVSWHSSLARPRNRTESCRSISRRISSLAPSALRTTRQGQRARRAPRSCGRTGRGRTTKPNGTSSRITGRSISTWQRAAIRAPRFCIGARCRSTNRASCFAPFSPRRGLPMLPSKTSPSRAGLRWQCSSRDGWRRRTPSDTGSLGSNPRAAMFPSPTLRREGQFHRNARR